MPNNSFRPGGFSIVLAVLTVIFVFKIVMGWFIAFFAGLFSLIMAEDHLLGLPENIIVAVVTSLIGGYVAVNTVRRGDALMSGHQMHLIAVSWFLPISVLSILFTISAGELLIPVA